MMFCDNCDKDISAERFKHVCLVPKVWKDNINTPEPRKYAPVMSLYWYKELESSRPTLYNTFLTEDEAYEMCKGYHTYGRVSGIGGLL